MSDAWSKKPAKRAKHRGAGWRYSGPGDLPPHLHKYVRAARNYWGQDLPRPVRWTMGSTGHDATYLDGVATISPTTIRGADRDYRATVFAHEYGHALGKAHDDPNRVMALKVPREFRLAFSKPRAARHNRRRAAARSRLGL